MAKANIVIWAKRIQDSCIQHPQWRAEGREGPAPEPQAWPPCEEWTGYPGGLRLHLWIGTEAQLALW